MANCPGFDAQYRTRSVHSPATDTSRASCHTDGTDDDWEHSVAGELRGWHPDPFNAHERRYFSMDGKPTRLVCDGGRTSHDPPLPTPFGSSVGLSQPKLTVLDQRQIPPSVPQSGANTMIAPGSIAFPPLAATRDWEPDRPAIGQIY